MRKDEAPGSRLVIAANDNETAPDPVAINAALTRIAEPVDCVSRVALFWR